MQIKLHLVSFLSTTRISQSIVVDLLLKEFTNLFEKFLVKCEFEKDPDRQNLLLLKSLRKLGFERRFNKIFKDTMDRQKNKFLRDDHHYFLHAELLTEYFLFHRLAAGDSQRTPAK